MTLLAQVREFYASGLFREALEILDSGRFNPNERCSTLVLRAMLLQELGRHREAQSLAESSASAPRLSPSERGWCEYVLGKIAREGGELECALAHF